jgi:hypothetical protein
LCEDARASIGGVVLLRYWHHWKERRRLARLDADMLMQEFGAAAYEVAWTMARDVDSGALIDTRPEGHWDRVRNIIARRSYMPFWGRRPWPR